VIYVLLRGNLINAEKCMLEPRHSIDLGEIDRQPSAVNLATEKISGNAIGYVGQISCRINTSFIARVKALNCGDNACGARRSKGR
jgi:hypothetical protein